MISTAICLPNLELSSLPSCASISNITVLDIDNYARGVINGVRQTLTSYFFTYYDQVAREFIEKYFENHQETTEIIVTNYQPIRVIYERFKEGNREYFRCPEGTNRPINREICIERRISNKTNILIYNGRPYKIDVYERMWFSLAYLCNIFLRQDSENGIALTGLSTCLLDGLFLARANVEYNQQYTPTVFSAEKVSEILGPISLRNNKLEEKLKVIKGVYNVNDDLLLKIVCDENVDIKDDEDNKVDKGLLEEAFKNEKVETITVHELIAGEFINPGYLEVSDLENLKGDFDEILPIKYIFICGEDDQVFVELNKNDPTANYVNIVAYVDKCLQKLYGIFPAEIF